MKARVKASAWKQIPCCPIQLLQIQEWRDWNSPCWVETVGTRPRKAIPTCWVLSIIARASAISFWFIPQRLATFVWHLWCTFMPHAERRSNAMSKGDRINFHTPWTWSVLGAGMSNRQLANPQHHLPRRGRHWRQILGWCFYDATKHHISYIIHHISYLCFTEIFMHTAGAFWHDAGTRLPPEAEPEPCWWQGRLLPICVHKLSTVTGLWKVLTKYNFSSIFKNAVEIFRWYFSCLYL